MELTERVLSDLMPGGKGVEVDVESIITATCTYFSISNDDLIGASRVAALVRARQIAMYLCRELTELSLPKIGHRFGGRDHTTVMHSIRKITGKMGEDRRLYDEVTELTNRIKQS